MLTQLYLEDFEVELPDNVNFAVNKTFEELNNPTIICNDWSKSLDVPLVKIIIRYLVVYSM